MIREYIVILSDKQYEKLLELSEKAGEQDELAHLQEKIADWLNGDPNEVISKALEKEISDSKRLRHCEK